jgi:hypothetical protein
MRTTVRAVTFVRPFVLAGWPVQPAGTYIVETDEELIEGVSFSAYLRVATYIRWDLPRGVSGTIESLKVDPAELEAAIRRDAAYCCEDPDRRQRTR